MSYVSCGGLVERICDGSWLIRGSRRKKYKVGEAADIFWDAIPEADLGPSRCIVPLNPKSGIKIYMKLGGRTLVRLIMVFDHV